MKKSTIPREPIEELASLRNQVTELEALQEQLTAQIASQVGRTFKDAPVGLCYFDCEFRFVRINDYLAAINGLSVERHLGKTVTEVLPEIAAAGVMKELRQVRESGNPVIQGIVTAETPAHPGEKRTYMHDYYALHSDDGEITGVGCCVMDITDLRREAQAPYDPRREMKEGTRLALGSELKVTDLEHEVNELCEQLGIMPRYDVPFDDNTAYTPPCKAE